MLLSAFKCWGMVLIVDLDPFNQPSGVPGRWLDENKRIEFSDEDFWHSECAELADELDLFRVQADGDPAFDETYVDWEEFIWANELWLPIEQSCSDGVLLPMDMRAERLKTCPEKLLRPLRRFFEFCPPHVKHHLALMYCVMVRMERARRTGSPEWRPATAIPAPEQSTFFRPPRLVFRKYTG